MQKEKKYPFNMERHAHDIVFLRNRLYNTAMDLIFKYGEKAVADKVDKLMAQRDELGGLLDIYRNGNIAWLTGKELNLARNAVGWAASQRRG